MKHEVFQQNAKRLVFHRLLNEVQRPIARIQLVGCMVLLPRRIQTEEWI